MQMQVGWTDGMSAPIKIVVIGLGWIGRKHATLISSSDQCVLAGVCDVDSSHQSYAEQIGVPFYDNVDELISAVQPDGAVIATPNSHHFSVAQICARRKVDILIEKPIADTLVQSQRIVDVTKEQDVHVVIGHHRRHSPFIQMAKSVVENGELGKLVGAMMLWTLMKPADYFDVNWRTTRPGGGPMLINLIHEIDILRFVCGEIRQVFAHVSSENRNLEVEDSLSISLSFENGALGNIFASDSVPSPWSYEATTRENPHYFYSEENCYQFFGTNGALAVPGMEIWKYTSGSATGWQYPLEKSSLEVLQEDPLHSQLDHFCRVIRGEESSLINAEDGMRTLVTAHAVLESAEKQMPVEITH